MALLRKALKAIDRLKQAGTQRRNEAQGPGGPPIPISSLSIEDFHRLSDEQFDALQDRLLARYGKGAKTATS